jgi:hypothetical protein
MASKKSGSKAKSGGGAKAGKRTARASLKDLEAKGSQKIKGGKMKVLDKTSALL